MISGIGREENFFLFHVLMFRARAFLYGSTASCQSFSRRLWGIQRCSGSYFRGGPCDDDMMRSWDSWPECSNAYLIGFGLFGWVALLYHERNSPRIDQATAHDSRRVVQMAGVDSLGSYNAAASAF